MIKISEIVKDIVFESVVDLSAMSRGIINYSAYAKSIKPEVELRAHKSVKEGSIVVALSRLAREIDAEPLLPPIVLDSISVKSKLAEIAFVKTEENKERAKKLYGLKEFARADFLTITYGVGEISIFLPMHLTARALEAFQPDEPRLVLEDLASLTVQFGEHYIETPNMYYGLLSRLALRKINIVELVSTFTELTFLISQKDLNKLFQLVNSMMISQDQLT